jgi:phenylacetate-CoA ligase
MFVHPSQIAVVVRRFPEVKKARLVVSGEMANDSMALYVGAARRARGLGALKLAS